MYRGRFAPSPTGPLHFGSLIAAVASYLESVTHQGQWLVRMEDVDTPRTVPSAADAILQTLDMFGFEWHGEIIYQSRRSEVYAAALQKLQEESLLYPCGCSRKEITDSAAHGTTGIDGLVYPGTCRHRPAVEKDRYAWRIKIEAGDICFQDQIQGTISQDLSRDVGDFVLKRADGIFTYQLAVVVDDAEQGITHIVRGADLLDSSARQIFLQQKLGLDTPIYAHIPVAANAHGEKLSKQTLAHPLDTENPVLNLWLALEFLGQQPPAELRHASRGYLWGWARASWQLRKIPGQRSIQLNMQEHTL